MSKGVILRSGMSITVYGNGIEVTGVVDDVDTIKMKSRRFGDRIDGLKVYVSNLTMRL